MRPRAVSLISLSWLTSPGRHAMARASRSHRCEPFPRRAMCYGSLSRHGRTRLQRCNGRSSRKTRKLPWTRGVRPCKTFYNHRIENMTGQPGCGCSLKTSSSLMRLLFMCGQRSAARSILLTRWTARRSSGLLIRRGEPRQRHR